MAKQKGGREVLNADEVVNVKQGDVAALLKKKALADEAAAKAAASAEPEMVAAADGVFATDAQYMVAQAGAGAAGGASGGLSTGALLGIGAAAIVGGVLIGDAISDDDAPAAAAAPSPAPGNTPTPTPGPGNSGNTGPNTLTYTLTNQTDNLLGSDANEAFIGDNVTAGPGDTLNGAGGTDTLKLFATPLLLNTVNIEQFYYNAPGNAINVSAAPNVSLLEVDNDTGNANANYTLRNGQALTLTNTDRIAGGGTTNVLGNDVTALTLTLNGIGAPNQIGAAGGVAAADRNVDLKGTSLTTLNVVAGGTTLHTSPIFDSFVQFANTGASITTVNVSGNKNLDLDWNGPTGILTKIDATAATGMIDIDGGAAKFATSMTVLGGSNSDRVNMAAVLSSGDVINGGGGTNNTLALSNNASGAAFGAAAGAAGSDIVTVPQNLADNSTAAVVQGTSNFQTIEVNTAGGAQALDLNALNAKNTISGLVISQPNKGDNGPQGNGAANAVIVTGINAATAGNISITADTVGAMTLGVPSFISGGDTDTAKITLDNSKGPFANGVGTNTNGVDVANGATILFNNVDVLNLVSKSDGTPVAGEQNTFGLYDGAANGLGLLASDLNKIVITGDQNLQLKLATGSNQVTTVDASALTVPNGTNAGTLAAPNAGAGSSLAALAFDGAASTFSGAVLLKATTGADVLNISNNATLTSTVYTGGGSDVVFLNGVGGNTNTQKFVFDATALNAGDIKAGNAIEVRTVAASDLQTVIIDFSSALEGLLKNSGINLGATNANINLINGAPAAVIAPAISATSNIAVGYDSTDGAEAITVQIDLNGDGTYKAADDWQLTIRPGANVLAAAGGTQFGQADTAFYDAALDQIRIVF